MNYGGSIEIGHIKWFIFHEARACLRIGKSAFILGLHFCIVLFSSLCNEVIEFVKYYMALFLGEVIINSERERKPGKQRLSDNCKEFR